MRRLPTHRSPILLLTASLFFAVFAVATSGQASTDQAYEVLPIIVPTGWTDVDVFGLDDADVVAGYGKTPSGNYQAFVATTTGSAPLPLPDGYTDSWGFGVNDSGQVAGFAEKESGEVHAFIFEVAGSTPIPHPPIPNDDWGNTYCYDINDAGEAACWGQWYPAFRPFIGMPSGSLLVNLPGFSWGFLRGLNDASAVAGHGYDYTSGNGPGGHRSDRAFSGSATTTIAVPWLDGWTKTIGEDINNSGLLVGTAKTYSGDREAFVWDGVGVTTIPAIRGWTSMDVARFGINDSGAVVGHACCASAAWIWDPERGTRALGPLVPSEWRLGDEPRNINDLGHILVESAYNYETQYQGPVVLVPVVNTPPVADPNGPYMVNEGSVVTLDGSASYDPDPGDSIGLYEWDLDYDGTYDVSSALPTTDTTYADGPLAQTVGLRVNDSFGATDTDGAVVTVSNVAPTVGTLSVPTDPIPTSAPVEVSAPFSDPAGTNDTPYTCDVDYGEATETGIVSGYECSASHTYAAAGIYTIEVSVADKDEGVGTGTAETLVVVYDPDGGFVTGGGWIDSPEGAYMPDPSLTGKATFGFVSKYKKGASVPTGNTEFQFHAGDLNFHSTSYQWLVVTGSDYAKFKGVGTINGEGEYEFQIWAGDNDPDTFRIKIWNDSGTVYDNGMNQPIGAGSIIVHTKK